MMTGDVAGARPRRFRWESITGGGVILQEDGYRRLWLGRLLSHTALNAVLYTLLVLAIGEGSGASIKSALFITAYLLPTATLGTVSGVIVDRMPKNLVLLVVNGARVGLLVLLLMSSTSLWTVYGIALLIAITSQFASPAEAAALPHVVRSDQLTIANSTNNFGSLVSQLVGFAVLPPLCLNTVGEKPLFFIAAAMCAGAGVVFLGIHSLGGRQIDLDEMLDAVSGVRKQFAEAWEQLGHDVASYMSIVVSVLASTASLVAVTLMPRFAQDTLDIPVQNAIFVFMPAALGVVAGLRLVHLLERRLDKQWLVGGGFALLIVSFTFIGLTGGIAAALQEMNLFGLFDPGPFGDTSASIIVTIVFSTAAAFSYAVVGVASRSLVNERMPVQIQGRIFAAQVVLGNLASIPPILLAGMLTEVLGVVPVLFLTIFILIAAAGWTLAQALSRPRPLEQRHAG